MIRLELERRKKDMSQKRLGFAANVEAANISKAENHSPHLYRVQLERIAAVLGYDGDPETLLDEI